ncbi:MAG: hypothetical protein ACP5RD_04420 [bacterium]|jgi:hypothetical protein
MSNHFIFFIISKRNLGISIKEKTINNILKENIFNYIYLIKLRDNYLYGFFIKQKDLINIYKNYNIPIIELNKINIIDKIQLPFLEEIQDNLINILKITNLNLIKVLESLIQKIIKFNLILNAKLDNKIYKKNLSNIENLKKKYNIEILLIDNIINLKIELKSITKKEIKKEIKKISKMLKIPLKYLKNNQIEYEFTLNENYKELYTLFFILKTNKKILTYKYEHEFFPEYNLIDFLNNFKKLLSTIDKNFTDKYNKSINNNKKIIVFIFIRNIDQILKEKKFLTIQKDNIIFFISSFLGFLIQNYFDYIVIFDSIILKKDSILESILKLTQNKIYINYKKIKKQNINLIYEKLNKIKEKLYPHYELINNLNINNEFNKINDNKLNEYNYWYFTQHNKFYYIYCNNCLNKPYCENCNSFIKDNNHKLFLKINKSNFNKLYTKLKYKKINFLQMINNLILECPNCKLKYNIFNCQYCGTFNWKIRIFDPQKYINYLQQKLNIKLNKIDYKNLFSFYYDLYNNYKNLESKNLIIFDYYFLDFPFIIKELNIIFNLLELERIFNPKFIYFIENKELSLIEYLSNLITDFDSFKEHLNYLLLLEQKITKINY